MDFWIIMLRSQIIVFVALGVGILSVLIVGKKGVSAKVVASSIFSCLLSIIFWRLITIGPNSGTAICYIGDFLSGEVAALATGFSLYAVRRMERKKRFLPILSAVFAVSCLIAQTILLTAGQWVNQLLFVN
jgi:hypothetical protein